MINSKCDLTINLNIIAQNYLLLKKLCPQSQVSAVVKANCYGLGIKDIAPILYNHDCRHFFVANYEEGIDLRNIIGNDANIYILNGFFQSEANILIAHNLIPVIFNLEQAMIWQQHSIILNKKLKCIIHVNTGLNRLDMSSIDFNKFIKIGFKELDILYIMSHLASSEEADNISNKIQLDKFLQLTNVIPYFKKTIANSGGILLGKEYHLDLVRPGAALYGINIHLSYNFQNPIELKAPIIQLNELKIGESVGYNWTFTNTNNKSCQIATISIGYADGLPRDLSNVGTTYINGFKAPIVGLISMDSTIIDVSNVPKEHLFFEQKVEIIGKNNKLCHIACDAHTSEYEVLTRLGARLNRIYI